jgi:hypothetical protein
MTGTGARFPAPITPKERLLSMRLLPEHEPHSSPPAVILSEAKDLDPSRGEDVRCFAQHDNVAVPV